MRNVPLKQGIQHTEKKDVRNRLESRNTHWRSEGNCVIYHFWKLTSTNHFSTWFGR